MNQKRSTTQEAKRDTSSRDSRKTGPIPVDRSLVKRSDFALEKLDIPETVAQEFQKIKTYILLASEEAPLKTIAVTSSTEGEGSSSVAVNTALALALGYEHKVVLVDTNIRRPRVHRFFRLENRVGLTDILLPGVEISSVVQELAVSRLAILPAGDHRLDPPQFFRSPRFKRILDDLEARFDFVVLDCPACSTGTDTQTLASKVDGIMLVVRCQSVRREIVANAQAKLEKAKGRILGVILNDRRFEIPRFLYRRI